MADLNTIPLSSIDQQPDRVLVDAYHDGSAVWVGLASDDPDVMHVADLSPAEARRLAFRLFVAADTADENDVLDSVSSGTVEMVQEAYQESPPAADGEIDGPLPDPANIVGLVPETTPVYDALGRLDAVQVDFRVIAVEPLLQKLQVILDEFETFDAAARTGDHEYAIPESQGFPA